MSRPGSAAGTRGFRDGGFSDFRDAGYTDFRGGPTGGGTGVDIEDLLGGLFGPGPGRAAGRWRGADQEAELPLTVEEAYRGGRREVTLPGTAGPRTLHRDDPAGRGRRAAHPAGRRGRPRPGRRPGRATSTWSSGSSRTSATGWSAETSTSSCR